MLKFLHAADIHLDSPLKGLDQYASAPKEEIRGATRRALENLVDLALARNVDFVLIAGDVYDGDWKDFNTGLFFVSQMSRLRDADIPVVMISGNHDAANRMTRSLPLPANVELLAHTQPQTATSEKLRDLGVAVHGQSFARRDVNDNLARSYPAKQKGLFNIGLLHTSLAGAEGHEPYAPCTIDELRQREYDYWALGHVHNREVMCNDPPIVFCGNPQGRHIRETGAKGCYIVTVDEGGGSSLEFQPLDVFRWEAIDVLADDAGNSDDALDLCAGKLSDLTATHAEMPLAVRVTISGRSRSDKQLRAERIDLTNQIRAKAIDMSGGRIWVEDVKIRTAAARDANNSALQEGPLGELLGYIADLRNDDAELLEFVGELADLRRKLPDEVLRGDEGLGLDDADRLREMLDDVEPLVMSRFAEGSDR